MSRKILSGSTAFAVLALFGACVPSVIAGDGAGRATPSAQPTLRIIGGKMSFVPWSVAIIGENKYCSAVAINPHWVITAAHCPSSGTVYFPGREIATNRAIASPRGDIKLLRLSQPHSLTAYPNVDLNYVPRNGDKGTIYGSGYPDLGWFREAKVNVLGTHSDTYGGPGIYIAGVTGSTQGGDSGGPLLVNGKVAGVLSTGSSANAINNPSVYANLAGTRDLIASAMVGDPTFSNARLNMAIGKQYFDSPQRIMFWVNGRYAGETYNGVAHYLSSTRTATGVNVSTPAAAGDFVHVGIVSGVPGNTPPSPSASVILAATRLDAVRAIDVVGDLVHVKVAPWLFSSNQRVMLWINGAYAGETYGGTAYYMQAKSDSGSVTLIPWVSIQDGDELQIAVVPGTPGMKPGSPPDLTSAVFSNGVGMGTLARIAL